MSKPDWQNQSYSKSGAASGPSTMNSKITGNGSTLHSKIAKPTAYANGGLVKKCMADGGSVDDTSNSDVKYDMGEFAGVDRAVAQNSNQDWARGENYGDGTTPDQRSEMTGGPKMASNEEIIAAEREATDKSAPKSFKQAFKDAKDGSTFEWNGKSYKKEYAQSSAPRAATKKSVSVDSSTDTGDESARLAQRYPKKPAGRGVIDTSNIDPKTLLPRR